MATTYSPTSPYNTSAMSGNSGSNIYGTGNTYGTQQSGYTNQYGNTSSTPYPTQYRAPSMGGQAIPTSSTNTWRPTYNYSQYPTQQYSMSSSNPIFQPGPGATVPYPQQQQPNNNDPRIDYMNPDGTPHYNPQYGQNNNSSNNNNTSNNNSGGGLPRDPGDIGGLPRDDENNYPGQNPPTTPLIPGQQQTGAPNWNAPFNWGNYSAFNPEQQGSYNNYIANLLQFTQGGQNAYQYQQDFGEAQRRYNQDYQRGLTQDNFQQWLSKEQLGWQKQQGMFDQTQRIQETNFNMGLAKDQFANQKYEFGQTFGLQQQGQKQQYELDSRKQRLAEIANDQNYSIAQRQAANQELQTLNQNTQFGQSLDFQKQQETNRNTQFGQSLDFQKQQWGDQFSLDTRKQRLAEVANDQNYSIAQRQAANQELQTLNQNTQFGQSLDFQKWQAGQQFGLDARKQKLAEVANDQNYSLQQRQAAFQELQGLRDYEISQGNLAVNQQQVGNQNSQFYATLGQQGQQFNRTQGLQEWQAQQDYGYKYAALQQAMVEESNRTGISIQELAQSAKYQDAQVQIEREKLAQSGGLESRGLDIRQQESLAQQQYQQQQLAQQFAIEQMRLQSQKEQAALASTGRLKAPNARWLRAG